MYPQGFTCWVPICSYLEGLSEGSQEKSLGVQTPTNLCLKVGACRTVSTIRGFMCSTDHFVPVNRSVWPHGMGLEIPTSPVEEFTCTA